MMSRWSFNNSPAYVRHDASRNHASELMQLRNAVWFLYIALYTIPQSALNIITLVTGPFHSLNHLSSLGSTQPVVPNL